MIARATPFSKILIANRGEIALRIQRSARALGYRTVAVYSTADAQARHALEADEAICIGEPLPAQSYLRIEALIEAAQRTGADALHPGYGFLAENAGLALACRENGLVFIGPSPEAITAMGHKAGAKRLMAAAGVPCIPGYQGEDQGEKRLLLEAERIGFPVMIKATAGGGGRGMRLVPSKAEFMDLLRSAQSEARNAFGSAEVILERALIAPRHIEIQVFADRQGNAIHLGERDCSVQRRHQKLIEEAPSPAVSAKLRERMGACAVAAVRAIDYEGAGTLEFLLDASGEFFFMEMNTRLQVEHPVTEAITGLDLVELQLRVAAGEPLPLAQAEVSFSGHAIELRLCAEDATAGSFMPQSGTMARWEMPAGLRVEHALASGAEIPPYYDSMIAKLIAHGRTREEARRKLLHGLQEAVALGVTTNQAFLARCLAQEDFREGRATTAFIASHQVDLLASDEGLDACAEAVAAWLLFITAAGTSTAHAVPMHALPLPLSFDLEGRLRRATVTQHGERRFTVDALEIERIAAAPGEVRLAFDGVAESLRYLRDGERLLMHFRGRAFHVLDCTRSPGTRQQDAASDGKVRAAMNGRIIALAVAPGQRVEAGTPLLTLEAMKMEHQYTAPLAGVVTAVHVALGDQVPATRLLAEVHPEVAA